ncbi:hypothetical protein QBC38DRAFT_352271 [Podospora fimiseda]|uniref:Uncharacterized protein n=1 Tax=Podospora fimiseda TaxID=252190 RepID=A0AAN7C0E5_9PEZI|nr:hypothetical protein QBC38DRAFT_352271 [Podospora fimiseda]
MWPGASSSYKSSFALLFATAAWPPLCAALPSLSVLFRRGDLILDYSSPTPSPEDGPPASRNAIRDPKYLPYQIGGIAGSYALCLIIVALFLLAFHKKRRQILDNSDLPEEEAGLLAFNPFPQPFLLQSEEDYKKEFEQFEREQQYGQVQQYAQEQQYSQEQFGQDQKYGQRLTVQTTNLGVSNKGYSQTPLSPRFKGPLSPTKSQYSVCTATSPTSTILAAGIDLSVDQTIVSRDRNMAQAQLEEMYKHVMEQERAKEEGRTYQPPPIASPSVNSLPFTPLTPGGMKRERNKPSNLNLGQEKTQSRTSSMFSFLKSPRKSKSQVGMNISSPILTPMSGTFPRGPYQQHDEQEMNAIPPRQYAPAMPPPVPAIPSDLPFRRQASASASTSHLPSPDISPVSTQSIDSRINPSLAAPPAQQSQSHSRTGSDAESRSSTPHSQTVGLPTSPKPGVNRFPSLASLDSLPASPRPNQVSFAATPTTGTAVRPGGALPFRAYEPSIVSPSQSSFNTTKQTVFTRAAPGPLSPGMQTGMRTPYTGVPVPYTPYQPFSPVVPITPALVTREDRKRMKRLEPKTPTVEMVRDTDDVW